MKNVTTQKHIRMMLFLRYARRSPSKSEARGGTSEVEVATYLRARWWYTVRFRNATSDKIDFLKQYAQTHMRRRYTSVNVYCVCARNVSIHSREKPAGIFQYLSTRPTPNIEYVRRVGAFFKNSFTILPGKIQQSNYIRETRGRGRNRVSERYERVCCTTVHANMYMHAAD